MSENIDNHFDVRLHDENRSCVTPGKKVHKVFVRFSINEAVDVSTELETMTPRQAQEYVEARVEQLKDVLIARMTKMLFTPMEEESNE